jgi:hypothetical protein
MPRIASQDSLEYNEWSIPPGVCFITSLRIKYPVANLPAKTDYSQHVHYVHAPRRKHLP